MDYSKICSSPSVSTLAGLSPAASSVSAFCAVLASWSPQLLLPLLSLLLFSLVPAEHWAGSVFMTTSLVLCWEHIASIHSSSAECARVSRQSAMSAVSRHAQQSRQLSGTLFPWVGNVYSFFLPLKMYALKNSLFWLTLLFGVNNFSFSILLGKASCLPCHLTNSYWRSVF